MTSQHALVLLNSFVVSNPADIIGIVAHDTDPAIDSNALYPYGTITINGSWSSWVFTQLDTLIDKIDHDDPAQHDVYNKIIDLLDDSV